MGDLDEMISSSSSSSDENDDFLLLSDENIDYDATTEYALDHSGQIIDNTGNGGTNSLSDYVELKLCKYPSTGELFLIITNFDEKKSAMEVFRCDFAECINIEKNQIEEDFSIY